MNRENPHWGASRIHGELLMLGLEVAQSTVSKYMARRPKPPSQTWKTFLKNHAKAIAAIDMCVVPTLTFDHLFAFLVLGHGRRQLLWIEVTRHQTVEWLARQITEAFPWTSAPAYLVRDNDRAYGHVFTSRVRAMGIRDRPISPHSPWQNGYAERLIGTLRRECLDQIVIFGEKHLPLQLRSPFDVGSAGFGLMGASPDGPCDDVGGADASLRKPNSDTPDFLNRPSDQELGGLVSRASFFGASCCSPDAGLSPSWRMRA